MLRGGMYKGRIPLGIRWIVASPTGGMTGRKAGGTF
jgi:hypothetical protein